MRRIILAIPLMLVAFFMTAAVALADSVPPPNNELVFSSQQFWSAVIGALVPLVTYALNYRAPWLTEHVKAIVLLVASAIAGALFQLLDTGSLHWNTRTFEVVATAVVMAFAAHVGFYRPSGINTLLGGGRNASTARARAVRNQNGYASGGLLYVLLVICLIVLVVVLAAHLPLWLLAIIVIILLLGAI